MKSHHACLPLQCWSLYQAVTGQGAEMQPLAQPLQAPQRCPEVNPVASSLLIVSLVPLNEPDLVFEFTVVI